MKNIFYQGPSFEKLHNEYSKKGVLDPNAPVKSSSQTIINAPVFIVWSIVYNIIEWSSFNPDFSNIKLLKSVSPDSWISFELNKFPIKAKFAIVSPNKELTWTGKSLWTKAIDRITLQSQDDNKTILKIEEAFSGMFVPLFVSEEKLKTQHLRWLTSIKSKAELK